MKSGSVSTRYWVLRLLVRSDGLFAQMTPSDGEMRSVFKFALSAMCADTLDGSPNWRQLVLQG